MSDIVYPPVVLTARAVFALLGVRMSLRGTENIPRVGGAVLATNHVSHLDFVLAGFAGRAGGRRVRFMAKRAIFEHRVAGPLMRGMHHIPVDRDAGGPSFAAALHAVRAGEMVGVFPEATISRTFEPKAFKAGAARLAVDGSVPLIPAALWGTQRLATYDDRSSVRQRGVAISAVVGPPVDTSGGLEVVTARLRESVCSLLRIAWDDYPDDGTGQWWLPESRGGTAPAVPQE